MSASHEEGQEQTRPEDSNVFPLGKPNTTEEKNVCDTSQSRVALIHGHPANLSPREACLATQTFHG